MARCETTRVWNSEGHSQHVNSSELEMWRARGWSTSPPKKKKAAGETKDSADGDDSP